MKLLIQQCRFLYHFLHSSIRQSRVWLVGCGLLVLLSAITAFPAPTNHTKTILVLSQGNGRQPHLIEFMSGFQQTLATNFVGKVEVDIENLDLEHFDSPEYRRGIIEWLKAKYQGRKLDAIVAADDTAADITWQARSALWPRLPMVVVDNGRTSLTNLASWKNVTLVLAHTDVEKTLDAALSLYPHTRQIAFVSSGDNGYIEFYRHDLKRVEQFASNRFQVIKLIGLSLTGTQRRLAHLPPHTIVFYNGMWIDGSGRIFTTRYALARLSPVAKAPMFGFSDTFIGDGIVGGCCHVYSILGAETGRQVAAVIRAGNASAVPDLKSDSSRLIFDWQQLHRFGLDKKKLPSGSEVRFQPLSPWKLHHGVWMTGLAVLGIQTGLIGLLLLQRRRMRKAEDELSSSQLMLRTVLDTIPHHIIWKDREGTVIGCNRAVFDECGDIVGRTDFETSAVKHAEQYRADDLAVMERGQSKLNFEEPQTRADGSPGWYRTSKVPLHDKEGRVTGILATYDDITELKQAEEALRESERRQRTLAEATFEGICISENGRILDVNDQFAVMFGYKRNELIGRDMLALVAPECRSLIRERVQSGEGKAVEHLCQRKDGSLFDSEAQAKTVSWGDRKVRVSAVRDLTARKQLEAQLRQSQKMEAFGQLAAGVAHDFNNILTVIQGNASLLQMGLTPVEQASASAEIIHAAERGAKLTRQLLTFSRRQPMQARDLDLNAVVANITKMLQRLIGEDIALETRYAPGEVLVHADPGMLEQALMNLAVNARDAMPKGGRLIIETASFTLTDTTQFPKYTARPGEFICLSITDTGCGIAPTHLVHLFEPFFTTKEVGKGTGLGLATVYGIVEQHQGWIEAESELGQGTAFRIYLPRLAEKMLDDEERPGAPPKVAGGTETILLVEDEAALRKLMQHVLERHGYRTYAAVSGVEALTFWREHRDDIDILVTDMVMPEGMTGQELADQLRTEKPSLKIIYCSGYANHMPGKDSPLRDNEDFLEKPFEPVKLLQHIRARADAKN